MSARAGVSPGSSSSFYRGIPLSQQNTGSGQTGVERQSSRGREDRERERKRGAHASAAELISESMSLLLAPPTSSLCYDLIVSCLALPTLERMPTGCFNHTHPSTTTPYRSSVFSKFLTPPVLPCCNHMSTPLKTIRVTDVQ